MRKSIPWYEWLYSIDEYGIVMNEITQTALKNVRNNWYLYIWLTRNWITKRFAVHRIVWKLFVKNPNNLPLIFHIDNDWYNCSYDNLKWGTTKENRLQRDMEWRSNNYIKKHNPYLWRKWAECHNSKECFQYSIEWKFIKKFPCSYAAWEELWISRWNTSSCLIGKRKTAWWFIFAYLPPSPSSNTNS